MLMRPLPRKAVAARMNRERTPQSMADESPVLVHGHARSGSIRPLRSVSELTCDRVFVRVGIASFGRTGLELSRPRVQSFLTSTLPWDRSFRTKFSLGRYARSWPARVPGEADVPNRP